MPSSPTSPPRSPASASASVYAPRLDGEGSPIDVVHAPDRGDPAILAARAALVDGDHDRVRAVLHGTRGPDAEVRADGIAGGPEVRAALEAWHAADPDDPDLRLLLAVRRLDSLPWLALADGADPEAVWWDEIESLWRAVELLRPLPERSGSTRVWLAVAVGQLVAHREAPLRDFERCADEADEADPTSVQVLRARIRAADASADDAPGVRLAERVGATLPAGDPRHAEVVSAHIERYRAAAQRERREALDYWRDDDVVASVLAAAERFGEGDGGPAAFDAHQLLAFGIAKTPERRRAKRHFVRLDGRLTTWPWTALVDPKEGYAQLHTGASGRPGWLPGRRARQR